ncbi:RSC complex protein [Hygrophoropsis aurantiaca]|uniref:RSC complex protein n=1 Tax=Hygrophoropsis aurantiaca TaxID=72124 RepID=A0ACB8AU02_9AGAM|nr:RSC complex protein [Hygrophoropsis aurantiaca]
MSKRELGSLAADVDLDGPRAKRRKDVSAEPAIPGISETTKGAMETGQEMSLGESSVKEQGLRMWQVVKDAVNKDGLICSPAFMRLPPKRHYPDYYTVITQPICLDDIKKKLDDGGYNSLEAVRLDFEICFTNAKQYNIKNSPIWQDAKFLLKQANKEYTKITGKKKHSGEENGEDAEGEAEDGKKKNKPPNMNRLLKARLQKLVERTDEDTGRIISDVFMEMPSRKDYPMYYKQIKRPMCIENIFKHLKRKEYASSSDFATDVELVFSNALAFNQDHSQIWEDAMSLRDYFRQLMSDLPAPYALPQYSKPSPAKIKLKVPLPSAAAGPSGTSSADTAAPAPSQNGSGAPPAIMLKLPGSTSAAKTPTDITPTLSQNTLNPPAAPAPVPTPVPPAAAIPKPPRATRPSPQVTTQPLPYSTTPTFSHYPNATYQPHINTTQTATSIAQPPAPKPVQHTAPSVSRSPAPSFNDHRQLRGVFLTTKPRGRPILLDYRDGVKTWAMRLGYGENGVSIADVKFQGNEEEEGSDQEDEAHSHLQEEEEEEEEPVPKKRGRGRPPKNPAAKAKAAAAAAAAAKKIERPSKPHAQKAVTPLRENIQVIANGTPVNEKNNEQGVWDIDLQVGMNVLEVGEKGGMIWKVYMERVSIV